MCYDDDALYFAVRADEPDMAAVRKLLDKSAKGPWGTDLIEIFVDLSHDRNTYYQFAVNAKGERWHARHATKALFSGRATSWECGWHAAGKTDAAGWTVEVAIPYTCFDLRPVIKVGDVLGVNVCREDPRSREHSSWAFSHGAFHTPQAFGQAKGFAANLQPYRYEVVGLAWRRGKAGATVRNHTGQDRRVQVPFVAQWPDGTRHSATAQGPAKAGGDLSVSVPLPLRQDGTCLLGLRVLDEKGRLRAVAQPVPVRISGATALDLLGTEFDFYTRDAQARARCFVEAGPERCKKMRLRWRLEAEARPAAALADRQPQPGANDIAFPIADLPNGRYLVKAVLTEGGKVVSERSASFRKLPPARHEVRINQWGRFLVFDGRPFLWYGFYDSLGRGTDQRWIDALKEMQGVHTTAVLNYIGGRENYEKVGWALDQAHAHGQKMWVHLGWMLSYWIPKYAKRPGRYKDEAEAIAALRQVVTRHKDHPALLGWCTLDEPGNRPTMFTKAYTERYYRLIKDLDPHHPCIFSHLTRLGEYKVYGQATDLALMPFIERGGRFDRLFWELWDIGLPVAVNTPCFGALGGAVREPTPAEERVRVYKAIILGARGVSAYTFRCAAMETWREFGRLGKELQVLAPVLLTPDQRLRVDVTPPRSDVFALLKAHQGKHYLLAVNVAPRPTDASFRLTDAPGLGRVAPMFGTRPARVDAKAKLLSVTMDAQSTAVYEIDPR